VWHGGVTAAIIVTDDFDDRTTKFSPDAAISRKKTLIKAHLATTITSTVLDGCQYVCQTPTSLAKSRDAA